MAVQRVSSRFHGNSLRKTMACRISASSSGTRWRYPTTSL